MSRAPKPSLMSRVRSKLTSIVDGYYDIRDPKEAFRRSQARIGAEIMARRHQVKMQSSEFKEDSGGGGSWAPGGYESAERGRLDATWIYGNRHPDSALEESLEEQRDKANSAYKNHELFAGHVIRRVQRVAGTGIMIAPQIQKASGKITDDQAKEWNTELRDVCERWSHKAGGPQLPLYMIQRMVVRHIEKDGTAFVQFGDVAQNDPRIPINLRVKVIHPRRVETPPDYAMNPNVRNGVRTNSDGEVLGYYVRVAHPDDNKNFTMDYEYVPAFFDNGLPRMVQICELDEADQRIGYPHGQVGLRRFKNIDEYGVAEMERNIVASCVAGFAVGGEDPTGTASAMSGGTDSRGNLIQDIGPLRFDYLPNVDDVKFSNPNGPTGTYAPFVEHEARLAACGLGTSYEMMSGDWRDLSYQAGKLIWIDEQGPIDSAQLDVIELFLIPLWQNFINRCVIAGVIEVSLGSYRREPHIYERVKFIPQKRMSIDPARERSAIREDIAAGLIVHGDEVEQVNGRPREEVYVDIARNNEELKPTGISIQSLGAKGGTPLGGTNETAAEGGAGRNKREKVGQA